MIGRLRDARLKTKATLALTLVLLSTAAAFLVVLLGVQREQRHRLLEHDKRLVATLRDKYHRDLIYDVLSRNLESLAVDAADLARQPGIVWIRIETEMSRLAATADPRAVRRALGEDPPGDASGLAPVLIVHEGAHAELLGAGGRRLVESVPLAEERLTAPEPSAEHGFRETQWGGEAVLYSVEELRAAEDVFGRLHLLYSLGPLVEAEAVTRRVFYGLAGTSFLLLLLLINLLLSRIVLAPVGQVSEAMRVASRGNLEVRLPVHSADEIGSMAASFNGMVEQLAASKREIEAHSRELESRVADRTRALAESRETALSLKSHLATVIAHVATGVVSLDAAGRVTTFNQRAAELLGVAPGTAEGRAFSELLGPALRPLVGVVEGALSGLERREAQVVLRLPQGRRTLSVVVSPLGADAGAVVVFDDLTRVLSAERLEAWKQAVERVIHEIKNPLTPVGLAAQTLKTAYQEDRGRFDSIFPSAVEMILRSVQDLKTLIGEFSRFSRLPKAVCRPEDVNALVREALAPYEHGAPGGVAVRFELAPALPRVEADADQLRRVLLNVVNNGLEAMDGRSGELLVRTSGPDAAGRVSISVGDEGPGIDDVERIFEPHYTTKAKGTGLGLSIARQVVDEHGGEIRVTSRVGEGTTVEVLLPALAG